MLLLKDETKTTYDDFFTALDYLLYVLLFKKIGGLNEIKLK